MCKLYKSIGYMSSIIEHLKTKRPDNNWWLLWLLLMILFLVHSNVFAILTKHK